MDEILYQVVFTEKDGSTLYSFRIFRDRYEACVYGHTAIDLDVYDGYRIVELYLGKDTPKK